MSAPFFSIMRPTLHELNWSRDHIILYILGGSARVRINAEEYTLMTEDFIAVEPGSLYSFSHGNNIRLLQFTMPDALLRQFTKASQSRVIRCFSGDHAQSTTNTLSEVRRRLANLFDFQYGVANPNEILFAGRAILLYDYLYANFTDSSMDIPMPEQNASVYDYLCAAFAYAQKHACGSAKLTDAAEHIGVSPEYLSRSLRKYMDISFVDLIHQERMHVALEMLRDSSTTVMDIAMATGYSSASAFITTFKGTFGVTPGYYRAHLMGTISEDSPRASDEVLYAAIRKYIQHDAAEDIVSGGVRSVQHNITVSAQEAGAPFNDGWNRVMSICNAGDLLRSSMQEQIRATMQDLRFDYLYFHDVYNDDMMIYEEDTNGRPMYNFHNLDECLRFILSLGLRPYIELSFMPLKLARMDRGELRFLNRMNVTPPTDWDKWEGLVRNTLEFCIHQYGAGQVATWRFTSAMIYNAYFHELLTLEEYLDMYLHTRRAVKAVCPEAVFLGPGMDATLAAKDWDRALQPFLDFCQAHDCFPDMFSLRLYPIDYRSFKRRDVNAMREDRSTLKRSPNYFIPENYMHDSLKVVSQRLASIGYPPERVSIDRWNGNISHTDPSNDICYKSALIVKTVLENRDLAANLCYWTLSDQMSHLDFSFTESDLVGSVGLITREGLRKSAYYGMVLLSMLHGSVLAEGRGYILLRNGTGFQVMFYQYCHYNKKNIERMLRRQLAADPYMMCESGSRQVYTLDIKDVPHRRYHAEHYAIGRLSGGNLYEVWHRLGFTRSINAHQRSYLESASMPAYRMSTLSAEDGNLHISCVVEPHDVILINLTPDE